MRWSASDRALGVMTRPAVHRRSELLGTSIGTSFNGFLGLVLCAMPSPPILTSSVLLVLADGRLRAAVVPSSRCWCGIAVAAVEGCL
jgi:hypothetical protein